MDDQGDGEANINLGEPNDSINSDGDSSLDETVEISDETKWKCENCRLLNPEQVLYATDYLPF